LCCTDPSRVRFCGKLPGESYHAPDEHTRTRSVSASGWRRRSKRNDISFKFSEESMMRRQRPAAASRRGSWRSWRAPPTPVKITTLILERASGGNPAVRVPISDDAADAHCLVGRATRRRAEKSSATDRRAGAGCDSSSGPSALGQGRNLATSGAALIAAVAWTVSLFSNKRAEPNLQVGRTAFLRTSIRPTAFLARYDRPTSSRRPWVSIGERCRSFPDREEAWRLPSIESLRLAA
jgi:hypothetical protein